MAKLTPSQLDRSRPSSRLQPQTMLETTPVLFRLPSVQLQPLPPVADFPTESLMEFQGDEPAPSIAVNQPAPTAPAPSQTQDEQVEAKGSWWEHWSSGVILIVLLIAAYFACIAVLKSRGRSTSTLAKDAELKDANNLMIPPIITELQSNSVSSNSSTADDLVNSLSAGSPSGSSQLSQTDSPMATAELLEPKQIPELPLLDSFQPSGNGVNALPASNQLGQSPTLYDGANNTLQANKLATSLAEPSLPEFNAQSLQSGLSVPSLAGSPIDNSGNSTNSFTLGGPSGSANFMASSNSGATPDLSSSSGMNPATSYSNTPGIPNLVPNSQIQQPTASTVSTGSAVANSTSQAPNMAVGSNSNIRTTSTPEATDEVESVIRAFIELSRAGKIQSSGSNNNSNRYQPAR